MYVRLYLINVILRQVYFVELTIYEHEHFLENFFFLQRIYFSRTVVQKVKKKIDRSSLIHYLYTFIYKNTWNPVGLKYE